MFEIRVTSNVKEISKKLNDFARKQLPFAIARAVTELAREAQRAERARMESIFDKPKPFTLDSVRVFGATSETLTAGVFTMDRAANYLSPFEDGGEHFIAFGRGDNLLGPVQAPKTKYGGLPRGYVAKAKGNATMFTGTVQTRNGPINGLWQRTTRFEVRDRRGAMHTSRTGNLRRGYTHAGPNGKPKKVKGLRLLVRFVNNKPVTQRLDFFTTAQKVVEHRFDAVMGRELAKAIASSKLK